MSDKKEVQIVRNIKNGLFCSSGDLFIHHKYTFWIISNMVIVKNRHFWY